MAKNKGYAPCNCKEYGKLHHEKVDGRDFYYHLQTHPYDKTNPITIIPQGWGIPGQGLTQHKGQEVKKVTREKFSKLENDIFPILLEKHKGATIKII